MTQTLHAPTAAEIMSREVFTLDQRLGLLEATEKLVQQGVSNAPVVTGVQGQPVLLGFISEKDLMQVYASGEFYRDSKLTVGDVMRAHPVSVKPEADVFTLAAVFMQHGYRHVPVVKPGAVLLGIVSRRDVLRALLAHYHAWIKLDPKERRAPDLEQIFAHRFMVG